MEKNEKDSGTETQNEISNTQQVMPSDPLFTIIYNPQLDSIYQNSALNQTQSESQSQSQSQITQHNTQSFEHQTDSLIDQINDSNINDNDENDDNENNIRHKALMETANRLEKAATLFEDPENEGDEFFSTVWTIYTYFNHAHSFITILNAIHQAAGDVKLAVKRLAHQKERNDMCKFSYREIVAPNIAIENYFKY